MSKHILSITDNRGKNLTFTKPNDGLLYALKYVDVNKNILGTVENSAVMWKTSGEAFKLTTGWSKAEEYDLVPIKSFWYENPANFPAFIMHEECEYPTPLVAVHYFACGEVFDMRDKPYKVGAGSNWVLATKEELSRLYYKDK